MEEANVNLPPFAHGPEAEGVQKDALKDRWFALRVGEVIGGETSYL